MCLMAAAFVPHRSNKYFHVIASNGNYFELALYIMSASPIASVRAFETVRDADVVCARFGALPTLSVQDRAIIVLNDHWFWGYASGPSSCREAAEPHW